MKSRFAALLAPVLVLGTLAASPPPMAAGAPARPAPVKLLTCTGKTTVRPVDFVISCADANAQLTRTRWSTWGSRAAKGRTRFALNLCQPNCAASKMSFFPGSPVELSAPLRTKHHGKLFSKLAVHYNLHGKAKVFSLSWKGSPSFS
ncbi:MAG: hypothetical protein ACRDZX_10455 [Acidimicrobiales bacterium]